ncbi:hypothetical protein SPRG_16274 [Saprolegnia parasitica CBS 223.65]|uniref:Uncharacterized protein n=1 Tax=Saprolegnia parasitica (strain CBS 223.65) TaxID=695850 RepID=A0A067BNN1_SAPPC|nr:hypothetical protein SPRG_16274 [Saprolegnia parasitica CBS 223.65]KDO18355.1 hypothetical protein SPRG_16274 [Saprolegnia parasitica CBS 223.65]|eukprot:XP_012210937.1 hypothetical protein SPRG_16274 [Saprolegnia parasitica CBS 223.65]
MSRRRSKLGNGIDSGSMRGLAYRGLGYAKNIAGFLVILLILMDALVNNWTLSNYLGGGYFFLTPLGSVQNARQLETKYSYMRGLSIKNLSNMGQWMSNFTIIHFVEKSDRLYVISAGEYDLTPAMVLCPVFQGVYGNVDSSKKVKLALATDATTYYRGNMLTHMFTNDATVDVATPNMRSADVIARGYIPGQTTVDKRFTRDFSIQNTSSEQTQVVPYFRILSRNYCTGCDPVAELGYSTCEFKLVYNDAAKTLTVTSSAFVPGSTYKLGSTVLNSAFGQVAIVTKLIAILFAIAGYLAGRRTIQWLEVDPAKPDSMLTKVLRTVIPKYFPYQSDALSYDMFMYNSDIFVLLYTFAVLLDLQNSMQHTRNVNFYNALAPRFLVSIEMFSLSLRLLWGNLAILKLAKLLWNLLGIASYNGQSTTMGFFNFSSVTYLYLSAILLCYVPALIEYNNSVSVDISNAIEPIDGIGVNVINGKYLRVAPYVVFALVLNLLGVILLDHGINYKYFKMLRKNSLARQAVYNSTSILCDFLWGIEPRAHVNGADGAIVLVRARRLNLVIRKKAALQVKSSVRSAKASSVWDASATDTSTIATTTDADEGTENMCLLVQDWDRNIHLLDHTLTEVTSLVYNIKVLKNTRITIR